MSLCDVTDKIPDKLVSGMSLTTPPEAHHRSTYIYDHICDPCCQNEILLCTWSKLSS